MRVDVGNHPARDAIAALGSEDGSTADGLVFAPATGLADWDAAEDELARAFVLTQEAITADAPVVYLLDARALLGRAAPLDASVATGLAAGVRSLAFEGQRYNRYATAIAVGDGVGPELIADTVSFVVSTRAALGQVTMLGTEHLGALIPVSLAIITGGARGIGLGIARRLAEAGHELMLVDISDELEASAAALGAVAMRADITDPDGRREITAAVAAHDAPLGVLVNNAGITRDRMIAKMDEDAFRAVVRVNLGGAYALTSALVDQFADGGAVVNLSSRAQLGNVGQFNYIVSKGGVVGLTRAMALALAPRIRVNAVAPGFISTEMTDAMPQHIRERIVGLVPLGRAGEPADIANAVAFLASPEAAYMTGQLLYVDGGRTFSPSHAA